MIRCLKKVSFQGIKLYFDSVMLRLPSLWKYWKTWWPPRKVRELTKTSTNQRQRMRGTKRENLACLGFCWKRDQRIWWGYDSGNGSIEVLRLSKGETGNISLRHHGSIVFNCTFIFVDGWKDTRLRNLRRCSCYCLSFLKTFQAFLPTGSGLSLESSGEEEGLEVMDDLEIDDWTIESVLFSWVVLEGLSCEMQTILSCHLDLNIRNLTTVSQDFSLQPLQNPIFPEKKSSKFKTLEIQWLLARIHHLEGMKWGFRIWVTVH